MKPIWALWVLLGAASSEILTPPYFNLAARKKIVATATCGVDTEGPELYCKLVGSQAENDIDVSLIQGQYCDYCDTSRPDKRHSPENAIDGRETWWQSPPLSRGMKYNEVNLTIDLGQEFHVAYVFIRMGNSPRPGLWVLEKSADYGQSYTPWQYFSDSPADCERFFGRESLQPITKDDSVICSTEFSKIVPLEGGEIPISLLNSRPSANHYFNSSVLQEWTRATNVRIRLLRTKTFLGHLMSVTRQDPTVTRRYFYSIKDISIGGRCMCNGHADTCYSKNGTEILICQCRHNTCGDKCEKCCPGFEQKAWKQSKSYKLFACEPCNCFSHSNECQYDAEIDKKGLSLDIHGNFEGGGVCLNCQHNTEGINCNKCQPTFFRPYNKQWNETDVCQPCNCNYHYSTGNCSEGSGECECRKEYQAPLCDACSYGHYGYPYCKECDCFQNGTQDALCVKEDGECPCLYNFGGATCRACADGYFNFPKCEQCQCDADGSASATCNQTTGHCTCKANYGGKHCNICRDGFYQYPTCEYCNCDVKGTKEGICDKSSGQCFCKEGYGGALCGQCSPGFYGYPDCRPCNCSTIGSQATNCDLSGKCPCLQNFGGRTCDSCSPGFYKYPECEPCNCDQPGSIGITCEEDGKCKCADNFDDLRCDKCKEGFYNFPTCEGCNCHPAGVVDGFEGCGGVPAGELCQCKERVDGRICNKCKALYWNLNLHNPDGCEECNCNPAGVLGGVAVCDSDSGQCVCKPSVVGRGCTECDDGTFNLQMDNLFGCTDCGCDVGGSTTAICEKTSGNCSCRARVMGRTCKEPFPMHYFPTLFQYQYEIETGHTQEYTAVRYFYNDTIFPDYSWKGYAEFSSLQNEVLQEIYISQPSLYRMVLRYVNPSSETVVGTIKVIPDNPAENEQTDSVQFKPSSEPAFVTVSGDSGGVPSAFVMNIGRWTVSIRIDKNILLDYFVLMPEEFYLATVLNQKVEGSCKINEHGLCRDFSYPNVSFYDVKWGAEHEGILGPGYRNDDHLSQMNERSPYTIPILGENNSNLTYILSVNKPGTYVLVINYVTPINDDKSYVVQVDAGNSSSAGKIHFYNCHYTTFCRQVVTNDYGGVKMYNISDTISIELAGADANVGINSIVAIPVQDWAYDFIQPRPICIKKDKRCVPSSFLTPSESKKYHFESGGEPEDASRTPGLAPNITYVNLKDSANGSLQISGKVPEPDYYVFILQYRQPEYPAFDLEAKIVNVTDGKFRVRHCPSRSGCRATFTNMDGGHQVLINDNFTAEIKASSGRGVLLDYLLVAPSDLYSAPVLEELDLDRTDEFIATCGHDHFHIDTTQAGFCRDSVFSITAGYNNGALPCGCDYSGSLSFECDKFGGQCECKPNVIGRTCSACRTGFFGFPDCKRCNCPSAAYCEPQTGQCICPKFVTGEQCDQCMPNTYSYHPIIGCEECRCNPLGVLGSLQCDLFNGSCSCKEHIFGRTCSACEDGFFSFPYCDKCECDLAGTTADICDKNSAECFCKKNAIGPACNICRQGTFNLQATNEDGCSECFCFGKTSRCESSRLIRSHLFDMVDWRLVLLNETADLLVDVVNASLHRVNDVTAGADLTLHGLSNRSVYFSAPESYLGKRLNSYGGNLKYNIFYTIGQSGKAIRGADVILQGADMHLLHYSVEQPPATYDYNGEVSLTDVNFELLDGTQAKREHVMLVLENLRGLYIRASYWSDSITTRLSNVVLDDATPYTHSAQNSYSFAASVERCMCPENYQGLSCEECAPGFYRSPGPGGFCVPCDCNGHAGDCDVNTGKCLNCLHNTRGDHCELCAIGYHGNALQGSPGDCLICACPLPIISNNFATGCEVNAAGTKISCECVDGYVGGSCQSCGPGLYGRPDIPGDYCKPCQCSGNIDPESPSSCDTVSGECLQCLNNTSGNVCQFCKPGFFGDAVRLKNCQACVCDELGTDHCSHETGECVCKPNVIGEKCDRCKLEHYGFQTGRGCVPCQCGEAAYSSQCDDVTGQCRCKPGVTGRTCSRCAAGYWNYTTDGCVSCECRTEYSSGFSCDVNTGQCKCLKNVSGEKCENCPYRWVFIEDYGCEPCDNCVHSLLDSTDNLRQLIDPYIKEYGSADSGYFTTRRLVHINDTIKRLSPRIDNLDPEKINLTPVFEKLETLEQDGSNMHRKSNYSLDNSKLMSSTSNSLRDEAFKTIDDIAIAAENVGHSIKNIDQLTLNFTEGEGTKIESAVQEALRLLEEIKRNNVSNQELDADNNLIKTQELLNAAKDYRAPIDDVLEDIAEVKEDDQVLNEKLDDLLNHTMASLDKAGEANELYARNGKERVEKLLANIRNQTQDAEKSRNETAALLANATRYISEARDRMTSLKMEPFQLGSFVAQINNTYTSRDFDIEEIEDLKPKIKEHATNLTQRASDLHGMLSATKDTSESAINAANAYKDIVNAIKDAQRAAESSKEYVDEAAVSFNKLQENSTDSESNSSDLLDDAFQASQNLSEIEPRIREAVGKSRPVRTLNDENKENLDWIENALRQLGSVGIYEDSLNQAAGFAENANEFTVDSKLKLEHNFKDVTNETKEAKEIPKKLDDANRHIVQIEKQLNHVNDKLPIIIRKVDEFPDENERVDQIAQNIDAEIKKLQEQIAFARDLADRIKVGLKFQKETTLELRNPPNLQDLSTSTYISGYFKTGERYGLLLYLGNGNGTNLKRTKTDDYMVLEIENGYPVLTLDIGNGPERIVSSKYVATGEWYQFIIDRTGMNVKLIIREERAKGDDYETVSEKKLTGDYSIFNLDRNQSKLFLGSYPLDFNMQENIRTNTFEGEVEDLVIGDRPVSLWNFNFGLYNNQGAKERDKLVNLKPSTGYRFNGKGYAFLDLRSYNIRHRSDVELKFKTFATEGLLFLVSSGRTFSSLELRNGKILYQYSLGAGTKTWATSRTYNDGLWHTVKASRDGANGLFKVDDEDVRDHSEPISGSSLAPGVETIAFGGYPRRHEFPQVSNTDFDGCIDEVYIMGQPVDLSRNIEAYGVTPGCPAKFSRLISFKKTAPGYVNRHNISVANDFRINLKFKTKEKDGIIFYATDKVQSAGISLCLVDGRLKLVSQKIELVSAENNFNDSEWHVISVKHNAEVLKLDFDDHAYEVADKPPPLHLLYGNMYVGGVPQGFVDNTGSLSTKKAFSGCIGDATLNGSIINFANATDRRNEILGKCILDKTVGSDSDIHKVPDLPPLVEIGEVTDDYAIGVTVDPHEAEIPKRGDGGSDKGGNDVDETYATTELPDKSDEEEELTERPKEVTAKPFMPPHQFRPTPAPPPPSYDSCALPLDPAKDDRQDGSYQFGATTGSSSWLEYSQPRGKFRKRFDFSFEFKTTAEEGILFYASDQAHSQYMSVLLKNGRVIFVFDGHHGVLHLRSRGTLNNDQWHHVIFSRNNSDGKLVIDNMLEEDGKTSGNTVEVKLVLPFYLGGIPPELPRNLSQILDTTAQFAGCIRNFSMNGKPMEYPKEHEVLPCSANVEPGIFFGRQGGYVRLEERYNVGIEMHINMEIKPRKQSGLLLSAHGKHHYLILEMLNGDLKFTMFNGKQAITTSFVPNTPFHLCDGNWHHIQAVKSKSVVSLAVDKTSSEPGIGDIHKPQTHTTGTLFLGGHRFLDKIKGLGSREAYAGCIRNIVIKEKTYPIIKDMIQGDVSIGSCPTN